MSYNFNSIASVPPTGSITPYIGVTDPSGWAICDGVSRSNTTGIYNSLINAGLINQNTYGTNSSTGTGVSTSYLPATYTFNQMATSQNGQLILAGHNSSGFLYLSTNRGNTWSRQLNSISANWYTAAMSATTGQYQLAGSNTLLYLSTNTGTNWQQISGPTFGAIYGLFTTTGNWSSSAISNAGQYMLAGMNTGSLYLSTSFGIKWTLLGGAANTNSMPTTAVNWSSCSMNASGSLMSACVSTGAVYLSTNSGTNWSTAYGLSTSTPWSKVSIASSANYVVAAANSGNIYLSTDGAGATWMSRSGPGIGSLPIMVASGEGTNSLAYSYDGITWTGVGTGFITIGRGVAWNGSYWLALGDNKAAKSTDGINWTITATAIHSGGSSINLFWSGLYWIYCAKSNQIWRSLDGISWTQKNTFSSYTTIAGGSNGLPSPNNLSIVLGSYNDGNYNAIHKSTDYFDTVTNGPAFTNCAAITYANNIWMLACSSTGFVYYSLDNATTWTAGTGLSTLFATQAFSIGYGNGIWVAGGDKSSTSTNPLAYSTNNGVSWLPSTNGASVFPFNVTYNTGVVSVTWTGKYWVAAGAAVNYNINFAPEQSSVTPANTLAYSLDGITWTGIGTSIFSAYCFNIGWNGNAPSAPVNMPTSAQAWQSLAISGDGTDIIAGTSGSIIYASTTSGNTWTNIGGASNVVGLPNTATSNWSSMAISQDGNTWLADVNGAQLYISTDGQGKLWGIKAAYNILGTGTWNALTISQDGTTVLAGNTSSNLYVSYDSGNTYNALSSNGNLSGTKNWTGSAISQNNQIMAACATGDYPYLSSNSGLTWSNQVSSATYTVPSASTIGQSWSAVQPSTYSGIGQNWAMIPASTGISTSLTYNSVAMSSTGQFMIATASTGTPYLSSNYGSNWYTSASFVSGNYNAASMSYTGQYIFCYRTTSSEPYVSSTYGTYFTALAANASGTASGTSAMSATGQYIIGNQKLSSNYGVNWYSPSSGTTVNAQGTAVSATGQYIIFNCTNTQSLLSTNYGVNWIKDPAGQGGGSQQAGNACISASGQFMFIMGYVPLKVYFSSTFGSTWTTYPGTGLNTSISNYTISMSYSGQYMVIGATNTVGSYLSTNYGLNWATISSLPVSYVGISAVSANGQYMLTVNGAAGGAVYMSAASASLPPGTTVGTNFALLSSSIGVAATANYWGSSVSATGQYMVQSNSSGGVYFTSNYGASWVLNPGTGLPASAGSWKPAISANGQFILVGGYNNYVFVSSNFGNNWTQQTALGSTTWRIAGVSGDGKYMIVGNYLVSNYISSDYGKNWNLKSVYANCTVSVSYTGQYMIGGMETYCNVSSDYGANWKSPSAQARGTAVSYDGKYMISTGADIGKIFLSTNSGNSFYDVGKPTADYWGACMTWNGQYMFVAYASGVYISSNYGAIWNTVSGLSGATRDIGVSQYGNYVLTAVYAGGVYLSKATTPTNALSTFGPDVAFQTNSGDLTASWTPNYASLVAYFKFNESSGATTAAEQISAYNGTVVGGVTFGSLGKANTCATFNGSTGYITVPYQVLNNLTTGSITAWIYLKTNNTRNTIIVKQHDGTSTIMFLVDADGCLKFTNGPAEPIVIQSTTVLSTNTWYHVAYTFTGTVANFYINGQLDKTVTNPTNSPVIPNDASPTATTIGGWVSSGTLQQKFNGSIDDFAVWNTTLSAANILTIYNYQVARSPILAPLAGSSFSPNTAYATNAVVTNNYLTTSWTDTANTWTTKASSSYDTTTTYTANKLFTGSISDFWTTGGVYTGASNSYSGTVTTSVTGIGSIGGEWIQISNGTQIYMNSYSLTCRQDYPSTSQFPRTYYIIGSNDETTWYPIQYNNYASSLTSVPTLNITTNTSTQTSGTSTYNGYSTALDPYLYFRIIFTNNSATGAVSNNASVSEWTVNFLRATQLTTTSISSPTVTKTTTTILASVSPIYWYRFETADVNGTNLLNYASGLYDATLVNGANITTTAGQYKVGSGALSLTAGSSQYVRVNTLPTLSANGFSIAFWAYYISGNAASRFFDFSNKLSTDSGTKLSFYCMLNGGIDIRLEGGVQFTAPASQNTWKHYVCTYSSSGAATFYVDGVLTTSTSGTYPGVIPISYFFLGWSTWPVDPYITSYTDDFQFFNGYILTQTEVTNIYNYKGGALVTSITSSVVPNPYWYSVTTDSTGQYVVVGSIMNQGIWYSTDFANTWQNSNQILGTVQQLANSGTYMIAAINNISGVYYSSNYGAWWQSAATSTSNNYASVAMSSSSTYAIAGSLYGGVAYSNNYGQTWQSSNLTTNTYNAVAINPTGQYALASNNTTIYYSTNFGQTFTISNQTSVNTQSLAVSSTGQYAIAGTTAGIYYSMNFGQTWTISNQTVGTWYGINMMSSGQYVVAGNAGQGLWYSLNFGQTWIQSTTNKTDTWYQISTTPTGSYLYAVSQSDTVYQETNVTSSMSISMNGLPTSTSTWQTVAMDSTGQYQLLGINSGNLYYTNNFGNAWSTISGQSPMTGSYNSGNGLPTVALVWNTTKINSTGQYALAGINSGALYMSTNFAANWAPISGLGPLGTTGPWLASNYGFTTNSLAWQTTAMNSTGQYMMAGSNNNYLYLSTNTGTNWAIIGGSAYGSSFGQGLPTTTGAWYTSAISSTGQYMGTGLYGGAFYFSKNYGQAWTAFTNSPLSSAVNWYSMSMASSGTSIVASSNGSNIYNMTTMVIPTATYTPPQISNTSSTDGTGLKYIIKL